MPRYLYIGSYTAEGAKGVLKDGGTKRREAATRAVESVGGTVESFDFAFGGDDFYLLVEVPSNAAMATVSMTVASSGAVAGRTVPLLTPAEIDQAVGTKTDYTPPGR